MWTPLSAPMASPVLSVSSALSGPIVTSVTSPPYFSLSCSPASIAYSSKGFTTYVISDLSMLFCSASSFIAIAVSGTCFTHTNMFIWLPV